ncbi:MAG: hypothetical protein E6G12_08775 [Actinobacteria bacterium]|nr:MAG: hypothetical protein E6G12_08775 [Actinomycetota bacterium]
MAVYAVVLAAGASSRYGTEPSKQVQLLPKVLAALGESSVDGVVVVSGAHPLPVESVRCPDWERGPGALLRCGLAALPPEAEEAVVVLADGPDLDPRRRPPPPRPPGASRLGRRARRGREVARGALRLLRRPDAAGRCRFRYSSGILRAASFCRSSAGICSFAALRT